MLTKLIPLRIVMNSVGKYRIVDYEDTFLTKNRNSWPYSEFMEFDTLEEAQAFLKENTWHYVTNVPN
jgi:hypothetical protein